MVQLKRFTVFLLFISMFALFTAGCEKKESENTPVASSEPPEATEAVNEEEDADTSGANQPAQTQEAGLVIEKTEGDSWYISTAAKNFQPYDRGAISNGSIYRQDEQARIYKMSDKADAVNLGQGSAYRDNMVVLDGTLYYSEGGTALMAPSGDFDRAAEISGEGEAYTVLTDGVNVFMFGSDRTVVTRLNTDTAEITREPSVFENFPDMAYDGKFYKLTGEAALNVNGIEITGAVTQEYGSETAEEFRPDLAIQALAADEDGMIILHGNLGLELMKDGEYTTVLEEGAFASLFGLESMSVHSGTAFYMDGEYVYFSPSFSQLATRDEHPSMYRVNINTGAVQGLPVPEYESANYVSVMDGWINTKQGVYKLDGDKIVGGWEKVDGYIYEPLDIELVDY